MKKPALICISGPTGVGKTAVSLQLARRHNCPIISSDSRQMYKEMNIGVGKPTEEELKEITHYFIGQISVETRYSAGDFEREALALLDTLFKEHNVVILIGGTGLYNKAVLEGLDDFPEVNKEDLSMDYNALSIEKLQALLQEKDPTFYEKVDRQNSRRIIRALEVIDVSGASYSSFLGQQKPERPFKILKIRLDLPRGTLYNRINRRVDKMVKAGLVEEVRSLLPFKHFRALQSVGYQELFPYFDGEIDLAEAIEKIKIHSRRYAKRQNTWLKKYFAKESMDPNNESSIFERVENFLQS